MKKFLKFLNETPVNIGSVLKSPQRAEFIKEILIKIEKIKLNKSSKNYGSFKFIIDNNLFILLNNKEDTLGFLTFGLKNKRLQILNIENLKEIKGFSIICYQIILKNIADEILTGNLLSKENIKAHKNMFMYFRMFLFDGREFDENDRIESEEEIKNIMKDYSKSSQFLIKELFSDILEFHNQNYSPSWVQVEEANLLEKFIQNSET